jgi:hypothetical protein
MKTTIVIHNNMEMPIDRGMLEKVLIKCEWHIPANGNLDSTIDIYTKPRDSKGWLEWSMIINALSERAFYIACIQRKPDAEYEFCS